jgi:hypothetical protein
MKNKDTYDQPTFNFSILMYSAKAAATQLIWPVGGIGLPVIYFGFEGSLPEMLLLFFGCFMVITGLYLIACILVTKVKLSDKAAAAGYLSLSDKDKGKQIADTLIGW